MRQRDQQFRGDQRSRKRRIDVADDDHEAGASRQHNRFKAHHDASRLLRAAARADLQIDVRARNASSSKNTAFMATS